MSKTKCPHCGNALTATGYSFPYPQRRCESCIKRAKEKGQLEDRITRLENIVQTQQKDK